MEDIHAAVASMQAIAQAIRDEVESLPEGCIQWKPAPDVWTVMDNLCHIAEFVPYWTGQVQQMLAFPEREWGRTHHDPDRLAAVADTRSRDLQDVLGTLQASVAQSTTTLRQIAPGRFSTEAPSRNPRWGVKPASFLVDTLLDKHLQSHLRQIRRNRLQFEELSTAIPQEALVD